MFGYVIDVSRIIILQISEMSRSGALQIVVGSVAILVDCVSMPVETQKNAPPLAEGRVILHSFRRSNAD